MRTARVTVKNLQSLAAKKPSQAQALRLEARLKDLSVWVMEKVKPTKKGNRHYWMATWRERAERCGTCILGTMGRWMKRLPSRKPGR